MAYTGQGRFDRSGHDNALFAMREVHRRLHNMVRTGIIEKIDHNAAQARIKIGPLESAWIPWHTRHAGDDVDWAPPTAGEQVTVLCPSGHLSQAVFLHGLYQDKYRPPSNNKDQRVHKIKDGTTITQDTNSKTRTTQMPDDGNHTIAVGQQQNVVDTQGTRLVNDKATVHVHPDGKIRVVNTSGATHILDGGNVFINC